MAPQRNIKIAIFVPKIDIDLQHQQPQREAQDFPPPLRQRGEEPLSIRPALREDRHEPKKRTARISRASAQGRGGERDVRPRQEQQSRQDVMNKRHADRGNGALIACPLDAVPGKRRQLAGGTVPIFVSTKMGLSHLGRVRIGTAQKSLPALPEESIPIEERLIHAKIAPGDVCASPNCANRRKNHRPAWRGIHRANSGCAAVHGLAFSSVPPLKFVMSS